MPALLSDLKDLKITVQEAGEQTKHVIEILNHRVLLLEKGQEVIKTRQLDRLTECMRDMIDTEDQDSRLTNSLLSEIHKANLRLCIPRVDSSKQNSIAAEDFLIKVLTCVDTVTVTGHYDCNSGME